MARPRKLSDSDIARLVESEVQNGEGGEFGGSSLQQNRRLAWNYYLGRPRGDEVAGKSQLQSLDVADQVEHLLAQMMQAFTTDCPAEFEADGPQDESQVELESSACNYLIMEDNHGYTVLYQALKDALLFKNGVIKVYVTDEMDQQTLTLDGVTGADADMVEAAAPEGATVDRTDDSVTLSLEQEQRRLVIEAVEPANFVHTESWHKQQLDDIPMVGERKFYSRSELIGMGFSRSKVEDLPAHTMDTKTDSQAKYVDGQSAALDRQVRANDLIEVYEVYINLPKGLVQGAPDAERWRIVMSNRVILEKERVSFVPYCSGTPFIVPHRWTGMSVFDKVKEVQDAKTAAIRHLTDSLARGNIPSMFVQGDVNRQELAMLGVPGHHLTGGLNASATQLTNGDIGPACLSYLSYMDQVRASRAGAAVQMGSADSQLLTAASNAGATGMAIAANEQEMMTASITRTLSETLIRQLFLLVHRVAREQYRQPMMLRKADQYIQANPATWPVRKRVNVKTGLSPSERARKVSHLTGILQTQLALSQQMPGAVSERNIYRAIMNLAKAQELDNPEQYFLHPESQEAQQRGQMAAQSQQEQTQMQIQLQTLADQVKLQIAQMEDKTKRDIAALDAEIEEMKVTGEAVKEFELERLRAGSAQDSQGSNGAAGRDQPARES